ncbi:MAG: hypothetical protein V8S31_11720 [Lachnospiraceae bacterium]
MDDYDGSAVPPWAMRLRLEPEEFGRKEKETDQETDEYQTGKI